MRRLPLLLALAAALAMAGCAADDESTGDPTPTTSTPLTSTPVTSTPVTSTPVSPTSPAPTPEPKQVYNGTHDFAGAPSAPNSPPKRENFTVDEGYKTLQLRVSFASSGPAGDISLSAGASLRLVDPAGAVVLECTGKDDPDCRADVDASAGEWAIEYAGSGTSKATVMVTEVP